MGANASPSHSTYICISATLTMWSLCSHLLSLAALSLSLAVPATSLPLPALSLNRRIVVNPPILYPDNTTVWYTGQKGVNVTWDVPAYAAGYTGRLLLGYLEPNDTTGNEHLRREHLAPLRCDTLCKTDV